MPGGGEGTILPRLCSQPGERRPGLGALTTARPPPRSPHPLRARRYLGTELRGAGPARSGCCKVWQGAFRGRHRRRAKDWGSLAAPPWMQPGPPEEQGDPRSGAKRACPPPRVRARPVARGVQWGPLPSRTERGMGRWASLLRAGFSGYLRGPPPRGRLSSAWSLEPRELSSCRQSPDQMLCHVLLALAWVSRPLPEASRCGTTRPPGGESGCQVVAALWLWRESC